MLLTIEVEIVLLPQQALDQVVSLGSQIHTLQQLLVGELQTTFKRISNALSCGILSYEIPSSGIPSRGIASTVCYGIARKQNSSKRTLPPGSRGSHIIDTIQEG